MVRRLAEDAAIADGILTGVPDRPNEEETIGDDTVGVPKPRGRIFVEDFGDAR
jgi:hypothetical protein